MEPGKTSTLRHLQACKGNNITRLTPVTHIQYLSQGISKFVELLSNSFSVSDEILSRPGLINFDRIHILLTNLTLTLQNF